MVRPRDACRRYVGSVYRRASRNGNFFVRDARPRLRVQHGAQHAAIR
ncbi:hypothetical protein BURMUCF1_A0338 [Burkholderia multivorans ATCC BAA-247]|nr:hypothetical protein BURMUCGD2M_4250 [Burkholderia multivorans CGD2M]EJO62468.1 hypothetical protein BURMUCF1_A0338 [Burkholderia multivorans ATCC BAA-247]